jgi:hypothetical protein
VGVARRLGAGLEIVIPSIRGEAVRGALASLSRNSTKPDLVTIVTNELSGRMPHRGYPVRVIKFRSDTYPIGDCDLALRRNIGLWWAEHPNVLIFDDDQLAPPRLVAESKRLLQEKPYFWGHHRFVSFTNRTVEQILALPPEAGRARENPPNEWHVSQLLRRIPGDSSRNSDSIGRIRSPVPRPVCERRSEFRAEARTPAGSSRHSFHSRTALRVASNRPVAIFQDGRNKSMWPTRNRTH